MEIQETLKQIEPNSGALNHCVKLKVGKSTLPWSIHVDSITMIDKSRTPDQLRDTVFRASVLTNYFVI